MRSTICVSSLLIICMFLFIDSRRTCANDAIQRDEDGFRITLELGVVRITTGTVELRGEITNNSQQDIWVYDDAPHQGYPVGINGRDAAIYLDEDYCTLVVLRRVNVPRHAEVYGARMDVPYVRLRPGQSRAQVLCACLPITVTRTSGHEQGFMQAVEHGTDTATRLVFEVGYYTADDLCGRNANVRPFERIEFNDSGDRVIVSGLPEGQIWQAERAARITISGMSIPYREWLRCIAPYCFQAAPVQVLRGLFYDSSLDPEEYQFARDLLALDDEVRGDIGRKLAEVYVRYADGKGTSAELERCLDQILVRSDRDKLLRELQIKQAAVDQQRRLRIAELMVAAKQQDRPDDGRESIKVLRQVLQIDPCNEDALDLMAMISRYYQGEVITNSLGMHLAWVPSGRFSMGTKPNRGGTPLHEIRISRGFWIGTSEVTQAQYELLMGSNPGQSVRNAEPVTEVTWHEATEFCRRLSQKEGRSYRLPTEAEWEYACRAGVKTSYWWGEDMSADPGGPNAWGLSGMNDEMGEWCRDWFCYMYYLESPECDPQGPDEPHGDAKRVIRGRSFVSSGPTARCPCYKRDAAEPMYRSKSVSFRVVLDEGAH